MHRIMPARKITARAGCAIMLITLHIFKIKAEPAAAERLLIKL
ncbi:hypothetical protein [Rugamonas brunnea]|nr:hypothetical protein [Rugamonas brunnea]